MLAAFLAAACSAPPATNPAPGGVPAPAEPRPAEAGSPTVAATEVATPRPQVLRLPLTEPATIDPGLAEYGGALRQSAVPDQVRAGDQRRALAARSAWRSGQG